jgi:protein-disulfide isomerase
MRRKLTLLFLVLLLVVASAAQQPGTKPSSGTAKPAPAKADSTLPSEATVDGFLKHMFGYDPNISWKILKIERSEDPHVAEVFVGLKTPEGQQATKFYVMPDQKFAIAGEMMPFGADPFAPVRAELNARAKGVARGPANAAVTIVEFSDLQCPSCKAAQPTVDRLLTDVPNARFVFQNFPLDMHPWAMKAATYADCIGRESNDAFWKFIHTVYQNQEKVTTENADTQLKAYATESGANAATVAACAAQPATAARIRESLDLGKAVGVTGTPTLFVNGRKISNVNGIPYDLLKGIVQNTPK